MRPIRLRIKNNPSPKTDGAPGTVDASIESETIRHNELVKATAKATGQPEALVARILAAQQEIITEHLLSGNRIELGEMGILSASVRNVELRANGDIREGTPEIGVGFVPHKTFLTHLNENARYEINDDRGVFRPRLDSLIAADGTQVFLRGGLVELRGERLKFNRKQHDVGVFFTAPGKPDIAVTHYLEIHHKRVSFALPTELIPGTPYTVVIRVYLVGRMLKTAKLPTPVIIPA